MSDHDPFMLLPQIHDVPVDDDAEPDDAGVEHVGLPGDFDGDDAA